MAFFLSSAEWPFGTFAWRELCDDLGGWGDRRLTLTPSRASNDDCAHMLAILAPQLTELCCRPEDGQDCGKNGAMPRACDLDCASLWRTYSSQCPSDVVLANRQLAAFFNAQCDEAVSALVVAHGTARLPWQLQESSLVPHHNFQFQATSGTRYEATVRVPEGDGHCAVNEYDLQGFDATCASLLAAGEYHCRTDFCPTCGELNHYCDASCGLFRDGVRWTGLFILPPGKSSSTDAVALSDIKAIDRSISFTAASTGMFTAMVATFSSCGPVELTVVAVGTALELSPPLQADSDPHLLSVSCDMMDCTFGYDDEPVINGDGTGFDVVLDVDAGRTYAVLVELPAGQTAAQVSATFYQAGAAAGSAGFEPVVSGPLGDWIDTPAGHDAYHQMGEIPDSFGIHPGGHFGSYMEGTWVAPASGPVLLRLTMNCDVRFFADVQAPGCYVGVLDPRNEDPMAVKDWGCVGENDWNENAHCASTLQLTVTLDAYYPSGDDVGGRRRTQLQGDHLHTTVGSHAPSPIFGDVVRTDRLVVPRANVEHQVAVLWEATPPADRITPTPPTMEEMMVPGTPAAEMLTALATVQQQPHVVYPREFQTGGADDCQDDRIGHRRVQMGGDHVEVIIETHAPSALDAADAEQRLVSRLPGASVQSCERRRLQLGGDHLHTTTDEHAVCGLGSTNTGCTEFGQTIRHSMVRLSRGDVESAAQATFEATPADKRTMPTAPTLDEMLASGSSANALLAATFIDQAQPLVIRPVSTDIDGGCRRRLQLQGDDLHVTVNTHAKTAQEGAQGVARLATRLGATVQSATSTDCSGDGGGNEGR